MSQVRSVASARHRRGHQRPNRNDEVFVKKARTEVRISNKCEKINRNRRKRLDEQSYKQKWQWWWGKKVRVRVQPPKPSYKIWAKEYMLCQTWYDNRMIIGTGGGENKNGGMRNRSITSSALWDTPLLVKRLPPYQNDNLNREDKHRTDTQT